MNPIKACVSSNLHRVHTVLKSPSTLNVVAWKEVFDAFWMSKIEYKS